MQRRRIVLVVRVIVVCARTVGLPLLGRHGLLARWLLLGRFIRRQVFLWSRLLLGFLHIQMRPLVCLVAADGLRGRLLAEPEPALVRLIFEASHLLGVLLAARELARVAVAFVVNRHEMDEHVGEVAACERGCPKA